MNRISGKLPVYFCVVDSVLDNGRCLKTLTGKLIDNRGEYEDKVDFDQGVIGDVSVLVKYGLDAEKNLSVNVLSKSNSYFCYGGINAGDIIISSNPAYDETDVIMRDETLRNILIGLKRKLGLIE